MFPCNPFNESPSLCEKAGSRRDHYGIVGNQSIKAEIQEHSGLFQTFYLESGFSVEKPIFSTFGPGYP
jgi:hypothetical protein